MRVCVQLPDLKDAEAVQKFFLEEIQLGEELLAQGEVLSVSGVEQLFITQTPQHKTEFIFRH